MTIAGTISRTNSITRNTFLGIFCLAGLARAGGPFPLSGNIVGEVKTVAGVAEMGAKVLLYDRHEQLVRQVLTNDQGRFGFAELAPDLYSIRVTLASFVPALRRNIAVTAGVDDVLQINLSGIFSTVDLLPSPARGTLMGDDWKWVLRASPSTRPILRFLPISSDNSSDSSSSRPFENVFSETEGIVKVSAGDSDAVSALASQDMGTAFALATSIYGKSRLQVSGNVGYAANGMLPATGFRTTYTQNSDSGSNPEITMAVRQMYLADARGDMGPALREVSMGVYDHLELEGLHLEYGINYESVTFLDHLNYLSPFARATYNLGPKGSVRFAFSSGTQPGQLLARNTESSDELTQNLEALAMAPRISLSDAHTQVERREAFETSYKYVSGGRTFSAGMYKEAVSNAAFLLSGPSSFLPSSDELSQLGSTSQVFDAGNYQRTGYSAAMTQGLGENSDFTVAVGRSGALLAGLASQADADALRGSIHASQRTWMTARMSRTIRKTGTRVVSSYGWTDFNALMPEHISMTDPNGANQESGLNVFVRQPLPLLSSMFGTFGRFEATAELRNLLAQGYLPVIVNDQRAVLTNSPRAVRGGLSFIF